MLRALFLSLATMTSAHGATFYASASGSGTACTQGSPCQIASWWALAAPGDTLVLNNGTYTGANQMLTLLGNYNTTTKTCSTWKGGAAGQPLTVRAATDGGAIIDGQFTNVPLRWKCVRHVNLEGVRIQDSPESVVTVEYSTWLNFRRISAYNGNYYPYPDSTACPGVAYLNHHVMQIIGASSYTMVEDSIFGGHGRNLYNTFGASHHNIIRRSVLVGGGYSRGTSFSGCSTFPSSKNHGEPLQLYGVSDNVVENVIAIGIKNWAGHLRFNQAGMIIWVNTGEQGHRNKILGSIAMRYPNYGFSVASHCTDTDADPCLTNPVLENIVSYQVGRGLHVVNGQNVQVNYATLYGAGNNTESYLPSGLFLDEKYDADKSSTYFMRNVLSAHNTYGCRTLPNLVPGDAKLTYGLFYNNTTADFDALCSAINKTFVTTGVNPVLNSIAYVKSNSPAATAGENGGRVGADTRCRYISTFSGTSIVTTHTTQSLWPLPSSLNQRVINETSAIHGTSYDPNALVLDALAPRDTANIGCPTVAPTQDRTAPRRPTGLRVL
jgi:hypothetical protein